MAFNQRGPQKGFTIIELMIAISVFSVAIILITMGVLVISRQYQQASNRVKLESASREIHQQIAQSIQFSVENVLVSAASGGWRSLCTGSQRYTYGSPLASYTTTSYNSLKSGLYSDQGAIGVCTVPTGGDAAITALPNLLPSDAKVLEFTYSGTSNTLKSRFVSSSTDLLSVTAAATPVDSIVCKSAAVGREYCAVVQLTSSAARRVTN
jgi:prepilin-type N-terminal cleavage/methylation domain-containing protein